MSINVDNVLSFRDALGCVKEYENHLENEKKIILHTKRDRFYMSLKNPENTLTF